MECIREMINKADGNQTSNNLDFHSTKTKARMRKTTQKFNASLKKFDVDLKRKSDSYTIVESRANHQNESF